MPAPAPPAASALRPFRDNRATHENTKVSARKSQLSATIPTSAFTKTTESKDTIHSPYNQNTQIRAFLAHTLQETAKTPIFVKEIYTPIGNPFRFSHASSPAMGLQNVETAMRRRQRTGQGFDPATRCEMRASPWRQ